MEIKREEALLNKMEFVQQALIWAKISSTVVKITFKKESKSRKIIRLEEFSVNEEFLVNSVAENSFLLTSRGRTYPRNGNTFLIEDIASIAFDLEEKE